MVLETYQTDGGVATTNLLWATDIHLDFLRVPEAPKMFGEYLASEYPSAQALVITGDISETPTLKSNLEAFGKGWGRPLFFVLGNHEYYKGSFEGTAKIAHSIDGWLEKHESIELTSDCALVGVEGWYDGLLGFGKSEKFVMSDWFEIRDMRCLIDRRQLLDVCQVRSETFALLAKAKIKKAFTKYNTVVFATHYPPYAEACWHEGAVSDNWHLPWFTSKLMGDALTQVMENHPKKKLVVLCGHTHSSGTYSPLPNLTVLTGEAVYGAPDSAGLLQIKGGACQVTMKVNKVSTSLNL